MDVEIPDRHQPERVPTPPGSSGFLEFWGKARPVSDSAVPWHPIAYHSLDVAACAWEILGARPRTLAKGARLLHLREDATRSFIVAAVALHDLGKFGSAFQIKRPDLWPTLLGPPQAAVRASYHTVDGLALWIRHLRSQVVELLWRGEAPALTPLMLAVFGHHGRPVELSTPPLEVLFRPAAITAADDCARAMLRQILPEPVSPRDFSDSSAREASWWIAGLVTLSDWMGSNEQWFPYQPPTTSLAEYWQQALSKAQRAIQAAGLAAPRPSRTRSFSDLTGITAQPTPVQRWSATCELPPGPLLVIIEDVTGSGKTEAAQMLVHRLIAQERVSGAYWAMPTQATANAMYERQGHVLQRLFDTDGLAKPSLALAHSQTHLHEGFQSRVLRCSPAEDELREDTESDDADLDATASCAAYLADDRRRSLLADLGAGTIDQAVLSVLPSKFNTVRLLGLAEKVLVLDEVHAYDAYLLTEAKALLRFQALLGGSAILLSATLPQKLREELVAAWQSTAGAPPEGLFSRPRPVAASVNASAYPLGTIATATGDTREHPLAAAPWSHRDVNVRFVHDLGSAVDEVVAAAQAHAAVVWIRNTVDSCLHAAHLVRERGIEPIVFHARFAHCDRRAREVEVLRVFGKHGQRERRGKVLIATQVVEQSLDLDFDLMLSDLAPIDLLIQRAGRLWRHVERDAQRPIGQREFVVVTPPFTDAPDSQWLDDPELLPYTTLIYGRVDVLWRTLRTLHRRPCISTPDGVRELIESVYASSDCPDALLPKAGAGHAAESAARSTGEYAVLQPDIGYTGEYTGWLSDIRVPTRLREVEDTVIRLGRVGADGVVRPWAESAEPAWRAWALSEIRVSSHRVPQGSMCAAEFKGRVQAIRENWGRYEREILLIPLMNEEERWRGQVLLPRGEVLELEYTWQRGLTYARK